MESSFQQLLVLTFMSIMFFEVLRVASSLRIRPGGWTVRHKMAALKQFRNTPSASISTSTETSERLENSRRRLEEFGNLFVKDIQIKNVQYGDSNWFDDISSHHATLLHVNEVPVDSKLSVNNNKTSSVVSCLVLPSHQFWPIYPHCGVLAIRVIVLKSSPLTVSSSRGQMSISELLLNGNQVALIGHSGVGKTTELNALWPELFQILRDKKITTLYLRTGNVLYKFTYEDAMVSCAVVGKAGDTLQSLREYFEDTPKNVILVLHRHEKEGALAFQVRHGCAMNTMV